MNFVNWKQLPWIWYGLSFVIVVIDLLTKKLVSDSFSMYERVNVFPMFDITLRHNPGAAFSFLADQGGWQIWFFSILSAVVSVVLIIWMARVFKKNIRETIGLALILGGALGNLYDRVTLGYVVDFILVYYESYEYPAFNVADAGISVGAGILIFDAFFGRNKANEKS